MRFGYARANHIEVISNRNVAHQDRPLRTESKVEIDVGADRGLVEHKSGLHGSRVLRQRDLRIVEVAAATVQCSVDSGGLDSSFTRSVEAVRKIKVAVNDQSFSVNLADVASIEIEMRKFAPNEDDSLGDRTLAQ